jgi:hypothetical protein
VKEKRHAGVSALRVTIPNALIRPQTRPRLRALPSRAPRGFRRKKTDVVSSACAKAPANEDGVAFDGLPRSPFSACYPAFATWQRCSCCCTSQSKTSPLPRNRHTGRAMQSSNETAFINRSKPTNSPGAGTPMQPSGYASATTASIACARHAIQLRRLLRPDLPLGQRIRQRYRGQRSGGEFTKSALNL